MAFQTGYSIPEAQLTMTLSALTYSAETPLTNESISQQEQRMATDITTGLGSAGYGAWTIAWGPTLSEDRGNMMYVAQNTSTNQYAIVVRGTDWSFILNWIEDFGSLLGLVQYTGTPTDKNVQVAGGTAIGLTVLQSMNLNSSNTTIMQFLKTVPASAGVFVTGHSLGGCLASALAPIVANTLGGTNRVKVYTFAAPSAGNQAFAAYYNKLFRNASEPGESTAFRVYDTLDAIPNAWASLPTINTYYQGFVLAPQDIQKIVNFGQSIVANKYVQVGVTGDNSARPLTGHIIWPFSQGALAGIDPIGDALFLWQLAQQHSTLNYLSLLGVNQPMTSELAKVQGTLVRISAGRKYTTA